MDTALRPVVEEATFTDVHRRPEFACPRSGEKRLRTVPFACRMKACRTSSYEISPTTFTVPCRAVPSSEVSRFSST